MQGEIDTLWLIVATILVLSMQAGFLLLEGGRVRAKNSINVAQKNVTDLIVVWATFTAVGCWVMFGLSVNTFLTAGSSPTNMVNGIAYTPIQLIFQLAFCSTAATIVSGAVAERISFRAYLTLTAVVAGLMYPLAGRLIWGNSFNPNVQSWLADLGFIDFAGSTVVHTVGGCVGLVAALMIGPRTGRFNEHGEPVPMPAFNAVIALFGVFVLMFGWLGFNGGAISLADPRLVPILFNTLTTGVFGGCAGMMIGAWLDNGLFNPSRVTSGLLGGLVASTASVHYMTLNEAMVIGSCGGAIATYGSQLVLHRFKIDDPLDAVATHAFAGVFGTLCVAFVLPITSIRSGSRLTQFTVQLSGAIIVAAGTCLVTWLTLKLMSRFMQIRVSEEAEKLGLNYTEHGESVGIARIQNALNDKLVDHNNFASVLSDDADDEHSDLAATLNDVIQKYESASEQIQLAQTRFREFAETASDWLWEADSDLVVSFMHTNAQDDSADAPLHSLLGRKLLEHLTLPDADAEIISELFANGRPPATFEASLKNRSCNERGPTVEVRAVACHDANGLLTGFRGTMTDITIRKSAEARALHLSMHDELTGLPNRRALDLAFKDSIKRAIESRRAVIVAAIDLDGFKAVNDAYGHGVGDDLLIEVASRFTQMLRPEDIAFRTGGDEFVIIFDSMNTNIASPTAKSLTSRIIAELAERYKIKDLNVTIGASAGMAVFPDDHIRATELLRMADMALYAAKEAGKGRVVSFDASLDSDAQKQRSIEQDLHKAIDNEEFFLMYHPQVDINSEKTIGFEALIRWAHPQLGEISPADFIPLAENLRMMDRIGAIVMDKACEFASSWLPDADGTYPTLCVNVSPLQLNNNAFFSSVMDTLKYYKLAPERLELEITEEALIHDFEKITDILQRFRDAGVAIAVDDFGSGQTALRYLNQFPLTRLKVDRSFIRTLGSNEKATEITRAIVMLGHKLGIDVIAEGVEESEQLQLLRQCQCDQIQGFYFSRPLNEESATQWMLNETQQVKRKLA